MAGPSPSLPDDTRPDDGTTAPTGGPGLTGAADHFGFASVPGEPTLQAGTRLGDVTVVRVLGAGGMGVVYEGWQDPPGRSVAVKVVRSAVLRSALDRFEREAQILARLDHPDIARIHRCGRFDTPAGPVPYVVMELVRTARPLTQYATEEGLGLRESLRLMSRVAAAVASGHRQGIVHRDLKPGNILVGGDGQPKVIDFGVARCTAGDAAAGHSATAAGDVVGTLRYMSPEQLASSPDAITAAADVYALGLVLHELLTGSLPYELGGRSPLEAFRIIDAHHGVRLPPLERAARVAGASTAAEAAAVASIVAMCLERQPVDRYSTAAELAADLDRWLADEPVRARPPTFVESVGRLARRHRGPVAAAAVAAASLCVAAVSIFIFFVRAEGARIAAEHRQAEADRQAREARADAYFAMLLLAAEARDGDSLGEARRLFASARELSSAAGSAAPIELECLAASLDDAIQSFDDQASAPRPAGTTAVACSPDGRWTASGSSDGTLRIRGVATDTAGGVRTVDAHEGGIWGLAFSADGRWLASAATDRTVCIRETKTSAEIRRLAGHGGTVYAVAFAPDGRLLATASRDGTVRLWNTGTWQEERRLEGHRGTVYAVSFSANGRRLATGGQDGTVRLWNPDDGAEEAVLEGHGDRVFAVAFAADGERLASASEDGSVRIWDAATAAERMVLRHPRRVNAVQFVGDGRRVATGSADGLLRIWEIAEIARSSAPTVLRGHAGPIWSLAARPGSTDLVSGGGDGSTRLWDVDAAALPVIRGGDRMLAVACSPDGSRIAAGCSDGRLLLADAATLRTRPGPAGPGGRITAVAYAADGRLLLAANDGGVVQGWDGVSGTISVRLQAHADRVYSLDVSPDGRTLATASEDRSARLWDLPSGEPRGEPLKHGRRTFCGRFAPDGDTLATACEDRTARIWSTSDGRERGRLTGHDGPVNWLDFSADGQRLATASSDGTVRIWEPASGRQLQVLQGPGGQLWKVAFSPDATRIAAACADGSIRMWDAWTGRVLPRLEGHRDEVWAVVFSPDGRSLVSGSWDRTIRVWGVSAADLARRRAAP